MKIIFEETKEWASRILWLTITIVFIGVVLFCLMMAGKHTVTLVGKAGSILSEYKDHQEAIDNITAGVIVNKSIVNGHATGNGGMVINPATGQAGVIIGNQGGYKPTEYRLTIQAEYMLDGETHTAEKYFCVPVEVYQAYAVGDYFDSQNF